MISRKELRFYFFLRISGSQDLENIVCDSNNKSESSNLTARWLFQILVMSVNRKCNLTGKQHSTNGGFKENTSILFCSMPLHSLKVLTWLSVLNILLMNSYIKAFWWGLWVHSSILVFYTDCLQKSPNCVCH